MIVAFALCMAFVATLNFPPLNSSVLFHIDIFGGSLPVNFHGFLNFWVLVALVVVLVKSWSNYLKVVGIRHTTTIDKR